MAEAAAPHPGLQATGRRQAAKYGRVQIVAGCRVGQAAQCGRLVRNAETFRAARKVMWLEANWELRGDHHCSHYGDRPTASPDAHLPAGQASSLRLAV
eukprot:354296-Chlamydomonas_euryale.AAC.9